MSSLTLNIEHPKDQTWANENLKNKVGLIRLAEMIAAGHITGDTVDLHTSASNLVAAAGAIAPTQANVDDGDTVTIGGVVLTAKASGANGTSQFNKGANLAATCTNLADCINANTTLSKHLVASAGATSVAITARLKGSIGNLIVMATSDATAFALTQLTGGTGGPETAAQALER
jgi:phage tail sheath gpL-like